MEKDQNIMREALAALFRFDEDMMDEDANELVEIIYGLVMAERERCARMEKID